MSPLSFSSRFFLLDKTFTPRPVLCTGWDSSEDWSVWTLRIRENVPFCDGTLLTSNDVAVTLQRAKKSERYAYRLRQIDSIKVDQEQQVVITLTSPNSAFLSLLDIPIVKSGSESHLVPIGTGPYLYVTGDSDQAWLAQNGSWWQEKPLPLERIELLHAKDRDVAAALFSSQQIQLYSADLTGTQVISFTGSIHCSDTPSTVFHYIGFNCGRDLLSNEAVRRALSMGLQREQITQGILSGHAQIAQFPVSPASSLYPRTLETDFRYDAYTDALEIAGLGSGEQKQVLTLLVNSESSFKVAAAQHIAESLSALDLTVELRVLPWAEYEEALSSGDFDLYYGELRLTADWDISHLVGTGGSLNFGGYSNPYTDALLTEFSMSQNRSETMADLCLHFTSSAPILPICFKDYSLLSHAGVVERLTPTPSNIFYRFADWTIRLQPEA